MKWKISMKEEKKAKKEKGSFIGDIVAFLFENIIEIIFGFFD